VLSTEDSDAEDEEQSSDSIIVGDPNDGGFGC